MKLLKKIFIALLLTSSSAFAQQESIFAFYRHQMNIVNPAYVGVDDKTVLSTGVREQWTGIENAPETQTLAFGTSLGKNTGLGISMVSDKTFIEKQTFIGIDFSYKLKVSEKANLYLGIKGGGNFYNVNTGGLQTYNIMSDPSLNSISSFNPNVGVGGLLKYKDFFMSLSVPRLLNTERATTENGFASASTDRPHFYWSSGYDIHFDDTNRFTLKPSFFLRYVNDAPISMDFNTMFNFSDIIELGATYRTDNTFAGLVNLKINKRLTLGYANETSSKTQLARAKNTSEFILSFEF